MHAPRPLADMCMLTPILTTKFVVQIDSNTRIYLVDTIVHLILLERNHLRMHFHMQLLQH